MTTVRKESGEAAIQGMPRLNATTRRGKEGFYPESQRIMALLSPQFLISNLQNWEC